MNIDWSKAPEGFPLWLEGTNEEHRKHSGWYRRSGQVFEGVHGGQWRAVREGQFFTVYRNPEFDEITDERCSIPAADKKLTRSNDDLAVLVASKTFYRFGNLFWGEGIRRKDLVGKLAGSVSSTDGYRYVKCGKARNRVAVHRVVFLMHHGYLPEVIDHINRIRDDNRIENLRDAVTEGNNQGNQSHQVGRSSKYKGVCWDQSRGKWASYVKHAGKRFNLGRFSSEEHAGLAYNEKATELFGEFANLNQIRTPEQIAAEERLKAIDEMAAVYKSNYEGHVKDGCQALYDAGYRKQVEP